MRIVQIASKKSTITVDGSANRESQGKKSTKWILITYISNAYCIYAIDA